MPPCSPPSPLSPTLYSKCNTLFLSLLSSLPGSTSTNPLSLDLDNSSSTLNQQQPPSLIITLKMPPGQGLLGKTMNWDDTADKNLLLGLICDNSDFKPNFARTAAKFGITSSAASQRLGKLKKKAREGGFALGGNGNNGDEAGTNEDTEGGGGGGGGIKGKTTKGKTAAAKKGKAATAAAETTDDNDLPDNATTNTKAAPAKKRARKNEGSTPAAKKAKGANGAVAAAKGSNAAGDKKANKNKTTPIKPEPPAASSSSSPTPPSVKEEEEDRAISPSNADSEATTVKEEGVDEEKREIKHYRYEDAISENEEDVGVVDDDVDDGTQEV
ncbi:MAG: hypothetical protein Q9208_005447 [Pyrenodesmia sp. 3 TL-2023]